jgi:cold shock CspA family protein
MNLPLQVTFHNTPHSDVIEAAIHDEAAQLEQFFGNIMSCRVVIDVPHRHHKEGNLYDVRIDLKVPGKELVVSRETAEQTDMRHLRLAIREAFDEARRQLEDHVRQIRGQVKAHEPVPRARVARLFPEDGYGFLATPDDREIYFHQNSVLNGGFKRLHVGSEVRFVEEAGEQGPQASTVEPIGRAKS